MPTRTELQNICLSRLEDARALLAAGRVDGAAYMVGYVLETALKARICRLLDIDYPVSGDLSKVYLTHNYNNLVKLAGLENLLIAQQALSVGFSANWSAVSTWTEGKRYDTVGTNNRSNVAGVITALEDPTDGVLTWIQTLW